MPKLQGKPGRCVLASGGAAPPPGTGTSRRTIATPVPAPARAAAPPCGTGNFVPLFIYISCSGIPAALDGLAILGGFAVLGWKVRGCGGACAETQATTGGGARGDGVKSTGLRGVRAAMRPRPRRRPGGGRCSGANRLIWRGVGGAFGAEARITTRAGRTPCGARRGAKCRKTQRLRAANAMPEHLRRQHIRAGGASPSATHARRERISAGNAPVAWKRWARCHATDVSGCSWRSRSAGRPWRARCRPAGGAPAARTGRPG